ncbi:hypothetical protein CDAR_478111, partial [Caerostris darwini]
PRRKVVFFAAPALADSLDTLRRTALLAMPQNSSRPPGDSKRVTVPPGAQLPSSITPPASATSNLSPSAVAKATATMESMDITTDTSPDNLTTVFPAITETVVDISIRSALHYLHYKEILMAAEDILQQSIPAEFHTACLTFGQLQSLREHARTFITVQDILTSLINHTRTEANPTAAGHPMLTKTRQSLTDLQQDLCVGRKLNSIS